jgi:hypothetical protein
MIDTPRPVPLPKAEDYMPPAKAERLMRHCNEVLALSDIKATSEPHRPFGGER